MNTSQSSGFSISRVWQFALYSLPGLKWQLIIYAIVSVVCGAICLIPAKETIQIGLFVAGWTALPLMYYCAPLIFAKGADTRIVNRLIPVSTAERFCFYYIYMLVVLPIIIYFIPLLCSNIYMHWPAVQTPEMMTLYEMKFNSLGVLSLINLFGAIFVIELCFLCVEYARHNRILWGIVGVICANTVIGFLGAILGGIEAFKAGMQDGFNGKKPADNVDQVVERVMERITHADAVSITIMGVIIVMAIATAVLTYRTLKKRNL